jgi:hypothetical protein
LNADDLMNDNPLLNAKDAAKLAKEMKNEQKKKIEYTDLTLEEITIDELKERNAKKSAAIKAGEIDLKKPVIGGELVLKFTQASNTAEVENKEKFVFEVEMPQFKENGDEFEQLIGYREATMDPDSGNIKMKSTLIPFKSKNPNLYQDVLIVKVYKISSQDSLGKEDPVKSFNSMQKEYVGT